MLSFVWTFRIIGCYNTVAREKFYLLFAISIKKRDYMIFSGNLHSFSNQDNSKAWSYSFYWKMMFIKVKTSNGTKAWWINIFWFYYQHLLHAVDLKHHYHNTAQPAFKWLKLTKNNRTRSEICLKLAIKTPERHCWRRKVQLVL